MNDTPVRPPFEPPSRSAVFPLPDAILFPNTILPLFVFEPQYRLMLEECLKGDGLMTVVLMRKGAPKSLLDAPTYSTAGIGRVTTVMRLPDSCARVLVGGIARVTIRRYIRRRPYPMAEIEPMQSAPADPARAGALRIRLVSLFRALAGDGARDFIERIEGLGDPEITGDLIAAGLSVDPHLKQRILETAGVEERLERLERLLEGELRQARLLRRILAGAPRNLRDN